MQMNPSTEKKLLTTIHEMTKKGMHFEVKKHKINLCPLMPIDCNTFLKHCKLLATKLTSF